MLKRREVRLHVYHCSGKAQRLKDVNSLDDVPAALEAINELKASPENDSSQLGSAVRQVINDYRGSSLAAVVIVPSPSGAERPRCFADERPRVHHALGAEHGVRQIQPQCLMRFLRK